MTKRDRRWGRAITLADIPQLWIAFFGDKRVGYVARARVCVCVCMCVCVYVCVFVLDCGFACVGATTAHASLLSLPHALLLHYTYNSEARECVRQLRDLRHDVSGLLSWQLYASSILLIYDAAADDAGE